MRSPAFQFYVQDFLTGTRYLSAEETGAYILMLCYQWDKGGLPADDKELLLIGNTTKKRIIDKVKAKFALCEDGMLRNIRMEAEREKQIAYREQRRENANKRWQPKEKDTPVAVTKGKEKTVADVPLHNDNPASSLVVKTLDSTLPNKKTWVGNQQYQLSAGALIMDRYEQGITELMMGAYRTLRLEDILAEIEQQCPSGTIFTNEQHLLNKFKSVAAKMLRTDKKFQTIRPAATHDYSRYKRVK